MSAGPGEGDIDPVTGEVNIQGPDVDDVDVDGGGGQAGVGPSGQIDVGDVDGTGDDAGRDTGGQTGPQQTTQTGEPVVDEGDPGPPADTRAGSEIGDGGGGRGPPGQLDFDVQDAAGPSRSRDISSEQIARDVGAAVERGDLDAGEVSERARQRAIAEAKRERGGPAEPFRPNAPEEGTTVRKVGEDAYIVSLMTPTGRETVPIAFAGPRTGPRNVTGPREAVAPFEESEDEKIVGRPSALDRLEGAQRARVRQQTATQIENQFGISVQPEEVELREEGDRLVAAPRDPVQRQIEQRQRAANQQIVEAARRAGVRLSEGPPSPEVVSALESRLAPVALAVNISGGRRPGDIQVDPRQGLDRFEDFTIEPAPGGTYRARLTDAFLIEQAGAQIGATGFAQRDTPFLEVREGLDPETQAALATAGAFGVAGGAADALAAEAGRRRVGLTPLGRQSLVEQRALERSEITTRTPEAARAVDPLGVVPEEQTTEIRDPNQLEFDEQGRLVDVEGPEATQADAEASAAYLEEQGVPGPAADLIAQRSLDIRRGINTAGEVAQDAGQAFQDVVVDPVADVAGDLWEVESRTVGAIVTGGVDDHEGYYDALRDVARAPESEVGETTFAESAAEKGFSGAGSLIRSGIELPQTAASGTAAAAEGVHYTLDRGVVEGGRAAAETGAIMLTQTAGQSVTNPFRTAGMLIGSGAIFGAARAVGPRASLGTRVAIQPGEELLGYGGAGAFRGAARGLERVGAPRAAGAARRGQRTLFPHNEPLIMSEEAAIMAAQRGADLVGGVGRRVRGRAVETSQEVAPDVSRPRLLERAPSVRAEVDPESGLIESELDVTGRVQGGLRSAGARVREAPFEAGRRVRAAPGRVRSRLAADIEAAQRRFAAEFDRANEIRQPDLALGQRLTKLDLQAREVPRRVRGRASTELGRPPEGFGRVMDDLAEGAVEPAFGQRMTKLQLQAGEVPRRALSRLASEIEATQRRFASTFEDAHSVRHPDLALGQRLTKLDLQVRDVPRRVSGRVRTELGRPPEGFGRVMDDLAEGTSGPSLGQRLTMLELQAGEVRYQAGQSPEAFDELMGELGEGTVGRSDLAREIAASRFRFAETVAGARETAANLRDLTIRIGGERRTLFETDELDEPPIRYQGDLLDIEADTTTERDDSDFEPLEPTEIGESEGEGDVMIQGESGVAVQRVVARETGREAETEQRAERQPLRFEIGVGGERAGDDLPTVEEIADMRLADVLKLGDAETPRLTTEPEDLLREAERPDVETESETERIAEIEAEAEAEAEAEMERELEREQEQEQELELELELEQELELELETDPDDKERDRREKPPISPSGGREGTGFLASGWLAETVTDIATLGQRSRKTLTQEQLQARPFGEKLTGELPTYEMIYGGTRQQARIGEVLALFGGTGQQAEETITEPDRQASEFPPVEAVAGAGRSGSDGAPRSVRAAARDDSPATVRGLAAGGGNDDAGSGEERGGADAGLAALPGSLMASDGTGGTATGADRFALPTADAEAAAPVTIEPVGLGVDWGTGDDWLAGIELAPGDDGGDGWPMIDVGAATDRVGGGDLVGFDVDVGGDSGEELVGFDPDGRQLV